METISTRYIEVIKRRPFARRVIKKKTPEYAGAIVVWGALILLEKNLQSLRTDK
jgi:hypothetical protein